MAESELGTAVLSLRVETRAALDALDAFRKAATAALKDLSAGDPFSSFEKGATSAGRQAGRQIRKGLEDALKGLRFDNVKDALAFSPKNTLEGLRAYSKALRELAETSDLASGDTQALFDRLSAVDGALKRATSSSAQLAAEQRALNAGLAEAVSLREREAQALQDVEINRGRAIGALKSSPVNGRQADGSVIPGSPSDSRNPSQLLTQLRQASQPGGFDISSLRRVSDAAVEAGLDLQDFTKAIINGQLALPKTVSNLNEITRSFQSLAASTKSGTAEFNNFTQAGAKSAQKALLSQLDELKALRQVFEFGRAPNPQGGLSKDSFRGTDELLAFAKQVERTPAAIQVYINALEQAQSVTKLSDDNFSKLTAEIDRQRAAFDAAARSAEAFSRIQRLSQEQRAQVADAFIEASRTQAPLALPSSEALASRIAASGGTQPERLNTNEINQVREQQVAALRQQVEQAQQLAAAERQSKGEQQQLNAALEAGLQVLRTTVDVIDEQVQGYKFQNEQLDEQLSKLQQIRNFEEGRSKDARKRNQQEVDNSPARQRARQENDLLEVQNKRRREQDKERKRRVSEASSNALIGGAFPALFGQGLGASVGGAFGGGAGGLIGGQFGFGLSLIGTAAGAQFDEAINKLKTLGDSLSDPINKFSSLSEAGLLSSKGLEKQIQALIDTGREAEAAALIQGDLAKSYGDLSGAKELAKSSDELNRSWAELQVAVADLAATPLASVLNDVSKSVENFATLLRDLKDAIPKPVREAGFNLAKFAFNISAGSGTAITQGIARFAINNDTTLQARRQANGDLAAKASEVAQRSEARLTDLRQLRLRLISQEAQQQALAANATERQTVEIEKQIALENSRAKGELPIQQQKIVDDFNRRLLQVDERRLQLEKERTKEVQNRLDIERRAELQFRQIQRQFAADRKAAANNFADIQGGIEIQRKRSALGLSGTGVGALQEVENIEAAKRGAELAAVQRKAAEGRALDLEREAQILRQRQENLEDPKSGATQQEINAAVDAALQARNSAQEAKNQYVLAGDALKAAGAEIIRAAETAKGNLQDAFKSAQDAVKSISRGIEDSVLALSELRNTSGSGLNRFLSPQQVKDRQAAEAQVLRPQAEALANRLGIRFQATGTREQINKQLQDFIRSARQELRTGEDLNQARQIDLPRATNDLAVVSESLLKVNTELAGATSALAQKDWTVNVAVNANTGDYAVNLG